MNGFNGESACLAHTPAFYKRKNVGTCYFVPQQPQRSEYNMILNGRASASFVESRAEVWNWGEHHDMDDALVCTQLMTAVDCCGFGAETDPGFT